MKEHERKRLLERLDRDGATVGVRLPERLEVGGEPLDLRELVFEVKRHDEVPPGERERVERAKQRLRRERMARRQTIEEGELPFEEAEQLAETVLGIDRALNALESLEPTDLEAEAAAKETADHQRWLSFLDRVLDSGDGRRPRS